MIFLSHNHRDKVLVEQIAIRLRDIFGQDAVFYDSWSIQPVDGIVEKMNEGLAKCKLFLFFVSKNSLQSNMVRLEWQNAVLKAAHGQAKLIPVKLDDCLMPPVLLQSLYIDLFGQGLEVALRQIVDVTQGRNTFAPGPQVFSNLRAYVYEEGTETVIECHAAHYLEPISHFLFLVGNPPGETTAMYKSGPMCTSGFNPDLTLNDGSKWNAHFIGIEKSTVPGFPVVVSLSANRGSPLKFGGVLHEKKRNEWQMIPLVHGRPSA